MTDARIMECATALAIAFHGDGIAKSFPNGFYAASHTGFTGDDLVEFTRVVISKWLEQKPTPAMLEKGLMGAAYTAMNAQALKEIGS